MSNAFNPIAGGANESGVDNALTFVDPIGYYLDVEDVTNLLLFGNQYPLQKVKYQEFSNNTSRTYYQVTQDEEITNCGLSTTQEDSNTFNLSDIVIYVEQSEIDSDTGESTTFDNNYSEALYVIIPKEALPLAVDTVTLNNINAQANSEGQYPNTYTNNENTTASLPLQVTYDVGISTDYLNEQTHKIDLTKINTSYLNQNNHEDNIEIDEGYTGFYSNYYSGEKLKEEYNPDDLNPEDLTYGNAGATFSPSEKNRYYIFQRNLVVYQDGSEGVLDPENLMPTSPKEGQGSINLKTYLTNDTYINKDSNYYVVLDYYYPYTDHPGI